MSSGRELGVDLSELWHAGKHLLPQVAGEFNKAQQTSNPYCSGAFYRGGGLGAGDGAFGAYFVWRDLADKLDEILTTTQTNLVDTGTALVIAANNYAHTDAEARAEFEARKSELSEVTR
jgi:hypothetical protein